MKNKIILFHPQTDHERNYSFYWIPYSVLSIASELEQAGFDVMILDANANAEYEKYTLDFEHILFIGISAMIGRQISNGIEYVNMIRQKSDVPILWGGAFPTLQPKMILESQYADYIIRGPGEHLIVEFANALKYGRQIPSGVGRMTAEGINEGVLQQLDSTIDLADYNYNLVNVKDYVRNDIHISDKVLNYISSRGCPYRCGFCTETALYHRKWTAFNADRIVRETVKLMDLGNANAIKFYDANFFVDTKRVLEFVQRITCERDDFRFAASAHPQNILNMSDREMELLKKGGLKRLLVGLESGVQEELDFIPKDLKISQIYDLARKLSHYGIRGSFTFITGYPTMPMDNIDKTLEFVEKISDMFPQHEYKVHFFMPYPGTKMYDVAVKQGFVEPKSLIEWSTYDYYKINMPWVEQKYQNAIDDFNKKHCPYVHL